MLLSVLVPFAVIFLFVFTILIVICVYIKEHLKLGRFFGGRKGVRYDYDNENEMLRKHFNSSIELDTDQDDRENQPERKQILHFYLGMMRREVYERSSSRANGSNGQTYHHDSDEDKLALDDGHHCYPLCEKKFAKGDLLRRIFPCKHAFHERCIQIWLYKGEHQFCPYCRGNIMKEKVNTQRSDEEPLSYAN